jgi:HTH-type transcriptional regulator, glycine betaine synthesis regulator
VAGETSVDDVVLRAADTIGGLIELWGFKRALGRMWTVLYLSPQPMSAQDLGDRLSMSAGAVSMTLTELAKWGVVRKAWKPGERRDFWEPETGIWKMVSRVLRERELVSVRAAIEGFDQAIRDLSALSRGRGPAAVDKKRVDHITARLDSLLALARIGEALLDAILAGRRVDASPLMSWLKK